MGMKLVVGPINKGLKTDRLPFNIDDDSFPRLINAYQWRGRIKRKRGLSLLNRLSRNLGTTDGSGNFTFTINPHPIIPGIVSFVVGTSTFTDGGTGGSLITNGSGTATLVLATGVLTISDLSNPNTDVIYFPSLPVMGLEDWVMTEEAYAGTIAFDTTYSYIISQFTPFVTTDITFYKSTNIPFWWNGQNYQQFWTTNYQGAFWATNGVATPFVPSESSIGMQFAPASTITYVSNTTTTITFTITGSPLVIGDYVFFNEFLSSVGPPVQASDLNFQTGIVTAIVGINYTFTLSNANLTVATHIPGIIQYLTNSSDTSVDTIKWYDISNAMPGWVNFMPPLSMLGYSIADEPLKQYYLVGASLIVPFKDRLLFFGPVIQTSNPMDLPIYLEDTIIYSQNGTPFYTCSFSGSVFNPTKGFLPLLTPNNETATPYSFWEDQTGFGGFISAGVSQPITTAAPNEDALIVGFFNSLQTRLVYTGNDILPFNFYIINAELGSSSTFSTVIMDEGVITKGVRGYILTSQTECRRIDLEIPDVYADLSSNTNNGAQRVCGQRDFISEWIYFTYPSNSSTEYIFPTQTLQYNYRDNSWAIFNETYTTYGSFRELSGYTWDTISNDYPTWANWDDSWESGNSELLQPQVICGNQQGYVFKREKGTGEPTSLSIQNISGSVVRSPNHCLSENDYIVISGCTGTVASSVNGKIFSVSAPTDTGFTLNPTIPSGLIYTGSGKITRMYVPQIYSKQFPTNWELSRQTRIGVQQYLFSRTNFGQVTLLIFLSQDTEGAGNLGPIVPDPLSINNSLIYSNILYTCPESTNLGLTPVNTNLQQQTSIGSDGNSSNDQAQIWHRLNTSLIGDTVQFAFTLNDEQMRDPDFKNQMVEIEFHGAVIDLFPSRMLS